MPDQTQKGSATIIVFIVLLITLGGTAVYFKNFSLMKSPAETLEQSRINTLPPKEESKVALKQVTVPEQAEISKEWEMFKSGRYEFRYPGEWEWMKLDVPGDIVFLVKENNIDIAIMNISNINLAVIGISYCGANPKDKRCETETVKMKNGDSVTIDWGAGETADAILSSPDGATGFIFALHKVNADTKIIFRKILATFEFIQ